MIRTKLFFAAILFAVFVLQHPAARLLVGQEAIPDTPAGQALSGVLESANSSNSESRSAFLKDGFAKNDDETVEQRKMQMDRIRSELGKLSVKKIISSSKYSVSVACETANGPAVVLTVTLMDEPPHKIQSVALEMEHGPVGDEIPLDANAKTEVIKRLADELRTKYVFPAVGDEMATAVEKSLERGDYDKFENAMEFASQLSDQLGEICHDKHLRVRAGAPHNPAAHPGPRATDNHGFVKAEMLPGGIGYLKFNFFSGDEKAKTTAAAAMNFLGNSNALIFDLRDNGGGSPEMIAFLSSYLFDEPVHLNSFYNRPTETTTESWTQKDVPGKKFSQSTPVYVLTSSHTFSGAEEFSYNLKNLKRGTIVGQTTGGGAHPVMPVILGNQMNMSMPFARAINPVTETNWEGVGVKPDVEVAASMALEKAIELVNSRSSALASGKSTDMEKTESGSVDLAGLMDEATRLMSGASYADAIPMFAKITKLDPGNGAAWFNYGYCLHINGEIDQAMEAHRKAAEFEQFAGIATYNLACAYSLKNKPDDAIAHLEQALGLGFRDANQLESDPDLDNIRKDPRYAELIGKLKDEQ